MDKLYKLNQRLLLSLFHWLARACPLPKTLRQVLTAKQELLDELVKFALSGAWTTITYAVVFNTLLIFAHEHVGTGTALIIVNIPAISVSYLLSSRYVFARNSDTSRHGEIIFFFALAIVAVTIGYFALTIVEWIIGGRLGILAANIVVLSTVVFTWLLRFYGARFFIFKSHLERTAVDLPTELAYLAEKTEAEAEADSADADSANSANSASATPGPPEPATTPSKPSRQPSSSR